MIIREYMARLVLWKELLPFCKAGSLIVSVNAGVAGPKSN
jgi:hypothetical protein